MDATELLDRYVHAVSRYLPARQRADVAAELRSLLHETLDARAGELADGPPDAAQAAALLREMGKPETVALRYLPAQTLIGPALYPSFVMILRIMLIVLTALFAAAAVFAVWSTPAPLEAALRRVLDTLWQFMGYAIANVGLIVIIFYFLEQVEARNPTPVAAWDPYSLPAVLDPNQIKRRDLWGSLASRLLFIGLFNFFPNFIAFTYVTDGAWGSWPRFTPEFLATFGLWFSLLWALEAGLFALVLRHGRWRPVTRWIEVGLTAGTILLLYFVVRGGPILQSSFFDVLVKFGLGVAALVAIIELGMQIYRASRAPSVPLPDSVSRGIVGG